MTNRSLVSCVGAGLLTIYAGPLLSAQKLVGFASLPADTLAAGRRLAINEFDTRTRRYTGRQWFYRLEVPITTGQSMGDFVAVTERLFLVIERDNFEGAAAAFKKIYLVDLDRSDVDSYLLPGARTSSTS